jgi:CRP-like cAMP-binding protein
MTDWMGQGGLLLLAVAVIAAVSAVGGGRWLRTGLLLAGLIGAADALIVGRGLPPLLLGLLIAAINGLALLRMRGPRGGLDAEAEAFYRRHLSRLPRSSARLLIDQGSFIDARAGEVLTREGEPVESLHFLVSGFAAVLVDNVIVGRIGPGDLIGEAALIGDGRASATVRLADDHCRLWFIARDRLQAFLAVQPGIAAELGNATMAALQSKLERANRERAGE